MFPNQNALYGKKKRNRRQNPSNLKRKATRLSNFGAQSQYQAPHHDEPEDLTDDLAPTTSAPNAQAAQQTQPQSAGADNKLNFKFQKTIQKTPDWTKYQNNFKTISGASPDRETDEVQASEDQKPESRWDQKIDLTQTGFEEDVEMKEVSSINAPDLKVAIITEPFQYLNTEQVKKIDEALASRIQDVILNENNNIPQDYVPVFQQKPSHHLGHLPLTCNGARDLMWLHETLSTVPSPVPNTKLVLILQSILPKPPQLVKIGMFIPNFAGNLEDLQRFLQKQNPWYDMSSWILINSQKQDDSDGYYLLYCVPEKQAHIIDNRDRRMAYSLGTMFIKVYDKQWNDIDKDQSFDFRNIAKHLLVCVVTEPFQYLTLFEVEGIKLALSRRLANAIQSETEYIPTFRGSACHYKGGLSLWCESDRDLKWLKEAIASINSPIEDFKLTVKEQDDVPERAKAQILLPNGPKDEKLVVKILQRQNDWCDIESWVLFSVAESPETLGVGLVLYVPIEQVTIVKKKDCRLSYLLGYVAVEFDSYYL